MLWCDMVQYVQQDMLLIPLYPSLWVLAPGVPLGLPQAARHPRFTPSLILIFVLPSVGGGGIDSPCGEGPYIPYIPVWAPGVVLAGEGAVLALNLGQARLAPTSKYQLTLPERMIGLTSMAELSTGTTAAFLHHVSVSPESERTIHTPASSPSS